MNSWSECGQILPLLSMLQLILHFIRECLRRAAVASQMLRCFSFINEFLGGNGFHAIPGDFEEVIHAMEILRVDSTVITTLLDKPEIQIIDAGDVDVAIHLVKFGFDGWFFLSSERTANIILSNTQESGRRVRYLVLNPPPNANGGGGAAGDN